MDRGVAAVLVSFCFVEYVTERNKKNTIGGESVQITQRL